MPIFQENFYTFWIFFSSQSSWFKSEKNGFVLVSWYPHYHSLLVYKACGIINEWQLVFATCLNEILQLIITCSLYIWTYLLENLSCKVSWFPYYFYFNYFFIYTRLIGGHWKQFILKLQIIRNWKWTEVLKNNTGLDGKESVGGRVEPMISESPGRLWCFTLFLQYWKHWKFTILL